MNMLSLQHPYISVALDGQRTYGGGQQFSDNHMVNLCGCGIIAAADTLLYLQRWHNHGRIPMLDVCLQTNPLPFSAYHELIHQLRREYFPLIPYLGINGLMLAAGMQRFFRHYSLPFSCRWCVSHRELWGRIETMLAADLPVIMSAGPNFPFLWQKEKVSFYEKTPSGDYHPSSGARAHYFTVTGMDDRWLRISSWGRCYYMYRSEFEHYARRHSTTIVSNILYIERKT
ncbi:MAG: hypothetical protein K6F56_10045 [Oscillospiraceae bacterium]|nr:hypothetical protein [Oscillospiraceae bacterium]